MTDTDALKQEIDALIAALGDDIAIARPPAERDVVEKIRLLLESTREQRTGASRGIWEYYLPYAAKRCFQLSRLEEGWEDSLDYFASENAQFWVDLTGVCIETGDIGGCKNALGQILEASRMMKRDRITQVDILLQALDYAVEISEKKRAVQLYEEAEKLHRKYLAGGSDFTGSAWLPKIKKMAQRLRQYREKLNRYYQYAETVTVSLEAATEADLERVINYLQQNATGRITVTRRVKEVQEPEKPGQGRFRVRLKITLE
jgi:hypothetical protein